MRIYLSTPHMSGIEQKYLEEAFAANFVSPFGPQLDKFEDMVREYLGGELYCVALNSATSALHLALRIAGVVTSDEVWVSSMTFAGGVFPINYLGASPRFFDLDPNSWTIDVSLLTEQLEYAARENRLPKVIIPTDLYGQSVDLNSIENIAESYGVKVIVDSAESLGAYYNKTRKAGTGGDASIISFNANKIITTSGGGMLVTRRKDWAEQARFLATQARDPEPHYEHSTFGYNYRLSNICAAIGIGQMHVLDERVIRRREIFDNYVKFLDLPGVSFMPEPLGRYSTRWLTTLTINPSVTGVSSNDIRKKLLEYKIESRPLWKPMHMQPLYSGAMYHGNFFDEGLFKNGMCLPSGSAMTEKEQNEIIEIFLDCVIG